MLNIYGHFLSMPSNKVRLCASYLGLPHEYHHVDLQSGEHQTPEYLAINPCGRVPAVDDDGFMLNQSDAICKYMCALSGPSPFYPEDLHEQAVVNQWIDFSTQHVLSAMGRIFFNRVVAPMLKQDVDEASVEAGLKMLERDLPMIEAELTGHKYLVGDGLSLADITLIAALEPCEMAKIDLSSYPAIVNWRKTVMGRDFYQRVHAHFAAEMTAG